MYLDTEGNELLSGSQYSASLKPPFPKEIILPKVAKKHGVDEAIIDAMWTANSEISLAFGNAVHYTMEQWFKHRKFGTEKNYHLPKHPLLREIIESFPDKDLDITPEVVVSSVKDKMAGRIDGLIVNDQSVVPSDYKTDAEIKKNLKFHFAQLSFYAFIIVQFGYKVTSVKVWNYTDKWTSYESEVLPVV